MQPKTDAIALPGQNTLAFKVCHFFVKNPFEEMSTTDIQLKYSEFPGKVDEQLSDVVQAGLLNASRTRGKLTGMQLIYKAGPNLEKTWEAAHAGQAAKNTKAQPAPSVLSMTAAPVAKSSAKESASKGKVASFRLTPDLIKVATNIPLPTKDVKKSVNAWDVAFDAMDAPGKAVVLPEAAFRGAVLACGLRKRYGKPGVFEVRRINAETCGIWRLNDDGSVPKNLIKAA